ncbi:hypothetical protein SAMN05216360_117105 [Methylobacterium phyllostachyos]|uniref:Uncharacterized protein n=2 Tax=Methylobacterium phyllostachyos TaxID=582672 RepID=A0A1H0I0M9_9HYPH|nr:hypothetical protein SAMN05216360_117105 [Methylobacterium phyllostachyos]
MEFTRRRVRPVSRVNDVRFCTNGFGTACDVPQARLGCKQGISRVHEHATEALMLARPFRFIAPALAALGLIGLRLVSPLIGPATPPSPSAVEDGRVVFRHYL